MTGKELVTKAVLFQGPERVPYDLPGKWGSDFLHVSLAEAPEWEQKKDGMDEWGCTWEKVSAGDLTKGQVKIHPLKDYSMLGDYPFPDFDIPERYMDAEKVISAHSGDKFILAHTNFSLIHRLEYLRGHDKAWTDPYAEPENLGKLLDILADKEIDSLKHFAQAGVDGVFCYDDWGLQDRPIMSPEIFRKFFKPRYKKVFGYAREQGLLTFMHSCGYIIDLLQDMMESGLQAIQMDQQENMGMDNLAERFGGKLCFWCPVDIQKTMVKGSVEDVKNYARKLMHTLGKYNGGFIAKHYPSPEAVNHDPAKTDAMSEAFVKYGRYPFSG